MSIAERIFTLLDRQGKRQSDLARFLQVRPTTVSEWVHGKREPSGVHYERIADFSGCPSTTLSRGASRRPRRYNKLSGIATIIIPSTYQAVARAIYRNTTASY